MKKIIITLIVFVLFFTTGCSEKNDKTEITSEEELILAIEQYQYHKSFENLKKITDYLVKMHYFMYKGTIAPMQGFYTGIYHENEKAFYFLNQMYNNIQFTKLLKRAYSGSEDIENFLDGKQKFYPDNSEYIDILWGYFYATGDERVINLMCKIQKYEFNREKRTKAKRTLEKNRAKFPDKVKNCE